MEDVTLYKEKDIMWKEFVSRYLYNVIRRAIPSLYTEIDIAKKPIFLETELRQINKDAPGGLLDADLLVRVFLKDGSDSWVLLHTEIQGSGGAPLPLRMFYYMSRIFGSHKIHPVALAILTESARGKEGSSYSSSRFGTSVDYSYNRLAIRELDPSELESSDNPADIAFLAAQIAQRTSSDELERFSYIKTLMKLAAARGFNRDERLGLYTFIQWAVSVKSPELKQEVIKYEKELEEEGWAMWATYAQQEWMEMGIEKGIVKGIEEGIEKGMEKGRQDTMLEVARNFSAMNFELEKISQATGLTMQELESLKTE